jgi:hypothetical protein
MKLHLSARHWLDAFDPSWQSHIEHLIKEVSGNLDTKLKGTDIHVPSSLFKGVGKSQSKLWIPMSLVIAGLLIAAGWFGYPLLKQDNSTLTPEAEAVVAASQTVQVTAQGEDATLESTEAEEEPAASPAPGWAEEAAEPILATIQNNPPYIADDFSQPDDNWHFESWQLHSNEGCSPTNSATIGVEEGVLRTIITTDCPQVTAHHQKMSKYENHALQVDINFNGDPNGGIFIEKGYVDGYNVSFVLESWGTGRLELCVYSDDNTDCSDNEQ